MRYPCRSLLHVLVASLLCVAAPLMAAEGKWTPDQLLEHDTGWLEELGLEVPAGELWDPEGGGLLEAVVQIGGCSAGFVSEQGLLITNHHCVFGILQEHSTPERDLIQNGFLARSLEDELPASTVRAKIPVRFIDLTEEMEHIVRETGDDDLARFQVIDRRRKEVVARCEEQPYRRCQVAIDDHGVRYRLVESVELPDVRLVYAPPGGVGEYGGEVDNWSWPRHTGDFALLRVYAGEDNRPAETAAENRPYRPSRVLPLSDSALDKGDFVMVVGYPGRTYRSLVGAEMAEQAERFFPDRSRLYRAWLDILEAESSRSEEARIALAGRIKSLANREKNARGQVAGIARGDLLTKKRALEAKVLVWAAEQEAHQDAVAAHRELEQLVAERSKVFERDHLLEHANNGPLLLDLALGIARNAYERTLPDMERDSEHQDRNRDRLLAEQRRNQKRLYETADRQLMVDLLARLHSLDEVQQLAPVENLLEGVETAEGIAKQVDRLLTDTQLGDLEVRLAMLEEDFDTLAARKDSLLDFALELDVELRRLEEEKDRREGAWYRLRPSWRKALAAYLERPLDPDANGTLRVSLAHVEGYSPRDAVWMKPRTTLAGALEKHTGEHPFAVPTKVREAAAQATQSPWVSKELGDVPVAFLATGDTTGGSSGSPVLDGQGRLVGVNFDRVWENVANDFGYNPDIARNVSADLRYLLWMLDQVEGADELLRELGVETP